MNATASSSRADLLTLGFGTAVAMWTVGWLGRMPGVALPGPALAVGLVVVLAWGGFLCGRLTDRGWRGGALAGAVAASLNLLIVLSALRGEGVAHLLSVPGTIVGTAALMAASAALGARKPRRATDPEVWTGRFALVAAVATALLLLAGGLVTGREAGLSVPDWPQSFGVNMFLYPLARMTGNIYYEHTHRLYGTLVGVTTVALWMHLQRTDGRRWVHMAALAGVAAVVLQGVMGGLRVALAEAGPGVEVAEAAHETTLSSALRVAHGVFGQAFFALMVLIAAATSRTFRRLQPFSASTAAVDRQLGPLLLGALLVQLLLGALVRHLQLDVTLHISMGALVALLACVAGLRAFGLYGKAVPALARCGLVTMAVVGVQLALGVAALVGVSLSSRAQPTLLDALATTAHQTNGALLLGCAVWLTALTRRALRDAEAI